MRNTRRRLLNVLSTSTMLAFMATPSLAQEAVWDGSDDEWYNPFAWIGTAPDASTPVIIGSGRVYIPFSGAEAAGVTLSGTGILDLDSDSSADGFGFVDVIGDGSGDVPELNFLDVSSAGSATIKASGAGNDSFDDARISFSQQSTAANATVTLSNGGRLTFRDDSTAANASLTSDTSMIRFENNASAGLAHIISTGTGIVEFVDSATADGATIDVRDRGAAGPNLLQFRDTASAGNATINVSGIGQSTYADATATFFNDSSAGTATINLSNHAQAIFRADSTAASARLVSDDSLIGFQNNANAGSAHITNNAGSLVIFAHNATADGATFVNNLGGVIDVSLRSTQLGGTGAPVAIGSLSGAGDVYLGSAGVTLGALNQNDTISGTINDGYSPAARDSLGLGGLPSPTGGSLEKVGTGTLTLTGNNTYTGGTVISDGTLQVGDGGTSGSIVGDVQNDGTLTFNRSNDVALGGVISGAGAIRQIGAGRTELTGDSSAFAGSTAIEAGTLAVNGLLGGTLDVGSGGRLQGTGTVGTTTVSGTIAPGNSIGTLTVNGDITFEAGSVYDVEVDAAGQTDLIHALGTATINGGTVNVAAGTGTYGTSTRYTILTADAGRSGTFAGATTDLAFLDPLLGYDAQNAYLNFVRNGTSFGSIGQTSNEAEVGRGVESTGEGNTLYDATLNSTVDQARSTFGVLSGEIHASVVSGLLDDSRFVRDAINNRLRAAFETPQITSVPVLGFVEEKNSRTIDQPEPAAYNGIWASSYGSWGSIDGDGNAARMKRSTGGFIAGVDGLVTDDWRLGVLAGYSHSSFKVDGRSSSASVDSYHLGVYGGTQWGQLSFRSGLAYSWNEIDSDRHIVSDAFGGTVNGDYRAGTTQVFGELAYAMKAGDLAFEPFANLAYVNVHTSGFTEQGGAAALSIDGQSNDLTFSTFGMRASTDFLISDVKASARGMIGWRHAYGDVTPGLSQAFAGGDVFSIAGVPVARDAAVLEAGLDFAVTPSATVGVSYQGQLAADARDHSVKAQLNVRF
ncbi:autotransporter outer membrane beta-barrel domain-containing protein [Rhizobium nepotum]|uniref:autotransporter outer membrane beta-barrel domain-containing protein n=1 Tax=Rhizobium nepotum TaxID=1035271 RepID=UPI003CF92817